MVPDLFFSADRPVDDRDRPPACGEAAALADVLADGRLSGGAAVVAAYEDALAEWFGVDFAIAVNSGSSALHAALAGLGVGDGDEVLVPATAPLPTAMPILTTGATPVLVDTLPGALAMDPDAVAGRVSGRTKAAISLSLWGYPADDDGAAAVLAGVGVPLVEDAAQAHGSTLRGRYVGTRYRVGCFSTHDRAPLATGEGGFLLTDDAELAERVHHFVRLGGLRGRYGVNYKLGALPAAVGLRRLAGLADQVAARHANAAQLLAALPDRGRLAELAHPAAVPNHHRLVLTTAAAPAPIARALAAAGLPPDSTRPHHGPLHRQPLFAAHRTARYPHAEALYAATFQMPVHPSLPPATLAWITTHLRAL
ncbi:aminotransferase DegT [Pilimelia anulata]|uniref:Aminotransferase DegT n=1 Tax=Pilimelia anulata TaxID=53371 RepID=A0A8J3BB75_9ACTN|nr:DegT/DnrJ/EryC1/StrS family aminotransferase [Pilimelia anulata]GGJ94793.1 aminotransferase DegT [Pilimelia anulata]